VSKQRLKTRPSCPQCSCLLDGYTGVRIRVEEGAADLDESLTPVPGDQSVCIECGALLGFVTKEGGLGLEILPPSKASHDLLRLQAAIRTRRARELTEESE
jgi:hypothetical protein